MRTKSIALHGRRISWTVGQWRRIRHQERPMEKPWMGKGWVRWDCEGLKRQSSKEKGTTGLLLTVMHPNINFKHLLCVRLWQVLQVGWCVHYLLSLRQNTQQKQLNGGRVYFGSEVFRFLWRGRHGGRAAACGGIHGGGRIWHRHLTLKWPGKQKAEPELWPGLIRKASP